MPKRLLTILLCLCLIKIEAQEILSASISFECTNELTHEYAFKTQFYTQCATADLPTSISLNVGSATCNIAQTVTANLIVKDTVQQHQLNNPNNCNGGAALAYKRYTYVANHTITDFCDDWRIQFQGFQRPASIDNIVNANGSPMFIEATLNNENEQCYSTADIGDSPLSFSHCNDRVHTMHSGFHNSGTTRFADFRETNMLLGTGLSATYVDGFSPTSPLGYQLGYNDESVVLIYGNNNPVNAAIVLEARTLDGILPRAKAMHEFYWMSNDANCALSEPYIRGVVNASGAVTIQDTFHIVTFVDSLISFDIETANLSTPNSIDTAYLQDLPGATITRINNSTSRITWQPTCDDAGLNPLRYYRTDLNGAFNTLTSTVILVEVSGELTSSGNDTIVCENAPVSLRMNGCFQNPSFFWSSNVGELDDQVKDNPTVQVTEATTFYVTISENGVQKFVDSVTVNTTPIPFTPEIIVSHPTCFREALRDGEIDVTLPTTGATPYDVRFNDGDFEDETNFNNLANGDYTISVRDQNNCVFDSIVNLQSPDTIKPVFLRLDSTSCIEQENGLVELFYTGGVGPMEYSVDASAFAADSIYDSLSAGIHAVSLRDANGCIASQNFSIPVRNPFFFEIAEARDVLCFGDTTGLIVPRAVSDLAPFDFSTKPSFSTTFPDTVRNLMARNYTIFARDSTGCIQSIDTSVNQPDPYQVLLNIDSVSCFEGDDGSIEANVTGGTSPYQFSIDGTNFNSNNPIEDLVAQNYTLFIRDIQGCDTSINVTIEEPTIIENQFNIVQPISCNGSSDGILSLDIEGGTSPYRSRLNTSSFSADHRFENLAKDTFTALIIDGNGCGFVDTFFFDDPPPIRFITDQTDSLDCPNINDGSITVDVRSGGFRPFLYRINEGAYQAGRSFNNLRSGVYNINIRDQRGCESDSAVVINAPSAVDIRLDIAPQQCFETADGVINVIANGGTPNYQYSLDGLFFQDASEFRNLNSGFYAVTVRDAKGCVYESSAEEIVRATEVLFNPTLVPNICFGRSEGIIELEPTGGNAPYTFAFAPNGDTFTQFPSNTTFSRENLSAGFYTVVVTDQNGCVDTAAYEIEHPAATTLFVPDAFTSCFGPEFDDARTEAVYTLGDPAQHPPRFILDDRDTTSSSVFEDLALGEHLVQMIDALGCRTQFTFEVDQPTPLTARILPDSVSITLGESVQLEVTTNTTNTLRYFWDNEDEELSCDDCKSPVATPVNTTVYHVTVEDISKPSAICVATASKSVRVINLQEVELPNTIVLSEASNTQNRAFQPYGANIKTYHLRVYARNGANVFDNQNSGRPWRGEINDEPARPGVYMYQMVITYTNQRVIEQKGSVTVIR